MIGEDKMIVGSFYPSYEEATDAQEKKDKMMGLGRYSVLGLFDGASPIGYIVVERQKIRDVQ